MNMKKAKAVSKRKSLAERLKKALTDGIDFATGEKKLRTKRTRENDNGRPSS